MEDRTKESSVPCPAERETVSEPQDAKIETPNEGEAINAEAIQKIVNSEMAALYTQVGSIRDSISTLSAICKESIDYNQRYQRNTVTVLQDENKQKDKYITGIILVDLLKPVAEICSKIERRIRKCESSSEAKFLQDLLEEITDTVIDEYNVEVHHTAPGEPRPELIAKVDSTISTGDVEKKNLVAESLCASWTLNGRLIQKERVVVYKYDPVLAESAKAASDNSEIPADKEEVSLPIDDQSHALNDQSTSGEIREVDSNPGVNESLIDTNPDEVAIANEQVESGLCDESNPPQDNAIQALQED